MAVKDEKSTSTLDVAPITQPTSANGNGSEPGVRPYYKAPPQRKRSFISPFGVVFIAVVVMIALLSYSLGATMVANNSSARTASTSTTSSNTMDTSNPSTAPANVPDATQSYGNQPAKYIVDPDGAKHFTLTAKQVMWEPVKGMKRVLAWTIDGTVPGPMIHVTAGDHVRITLINHFPEGTTLHWHGLMIPSGTDGVPGVGMKAVMPGQSYTYDFTVHDQDVGTHWYHSHYDDLVQVPGGMYGVFIVDPRPGTPEARQAIHADVEATEVVSELGGYYVINGKSFPDTQPIIVKHGQTVHVRMIGASEMIHPMHLHGHFFNLVAEDGHMLPQPIQKDTLSVTPGDTYDLTFYAWAPPGSIYPFHCHILAHVMNPGQTGTEMGGLIVLVEYAK